ncbi:MAG: HD domain-containing phosphohydrolase [Actinomycetota bacterium]
MATPQPESSTLRLADLMGVLSLATDLGTGQPLEHGCFGARREVMAPVLRSLGAGMPPLRRARVLARATVSLPRDFKDSHASHCEVAQMLAGPLRPGDDVRACFAYLFETYDGSGFPGNAHGDEIPLPVRIAHVARDADTQRATHGQEAALEIVTTRAGRASDPRVVAALRGSHGSLFSGLEDGSVWDACWPQSRDGRRS